jgi:hypothetical protein
MAQAAVQLKCGDWAHVKLHAKPPLKPGSEATHRVVAKGYQASPGRCAMLGDVSAASKLSLTRKTIGLGSNDSELNGAEGKLRSDLV